MVSFLLPGRGLRGLNRCHRAFGPIILLGTRFSLFDCHSGLLLTGHG